MSEWKSKLNIRIDGKPVSPIVQFTPTFKTPHTVIHSVEQDSVGYHHQPVELTFTMTLQANAPIVSKLAMMAVDGKRFEVTLTEEKGTDWGFNRLTFLDCVVQSINPSNVKLEDVPTVSVGCVALAHRLD